MSVKVKKFDLETNYFSNSENKVKYESGKKQQCLEGKKPIIKRTDKVTLQS